MINEKDPFAIEFIVGILLITYFFWIKSDISIKNKHHAQYLLCHIGSLIGAILIFILIKKGFLSPQYFSHLFALQLIGFTFLSVHVKSVLIGKKAKLKYTHILPLALYCVVVVFNNLDIYFLDYQTPRDLFLQVRFIDKHYFSDIFVVRIIAMAMIIFDIFLNTRKYSNQKLADKSIALLRKEAKHLRWLYTYIILVTASTLISSFYYFSFLDPQYNAILYTLSRICTILSFVCMTLNPTIIPNVMQITKKIQKTATADISIFIKINETIKIDKLFLIKNITTRELATIIKIEEQEIIDSIKQHSDKNWKTYINSFRAEHAINLLKTDYLKNVSVITLGEASGFTSHQSFFRAFKENTGTTPGKFYKAHHKIA